MSYQQPPFAVLMFAIYKAVMSAPSQWRDWQTTWQVREYQNHLDRIGSYADDLYEVHLNARSGVYFSQRQP
jgi:hypothetical protein